MAILINAETEQLVRDADLPDMDSDYTICFWLYPESVSGDACQFIIQDVGFDDYDAFWLTSGGTFLEVVDGGVQYSDSSGSTLSVDTWYHAAVRRTGSVLDLLLDGATPELSVNQAVSRDASDELYIGYYPSYGANSRFAYMKLWEASLTQAEIQREMHTILPQRTANLYGFWPIFPGSAERVRDYSGNGRDWTEAGSPTDADPPPVSWGAQPLYMPWVSAGAPAAIYGERGGMRGVLRGAYRGV